MPTARPTKCTHNMPNLPAQIGLVKTLRGRICDLPGEQLDMLVEALKYKADLRLRAATAQRAYLKRTGRHK